jgi:hypothetical protein
MTAVETSRIALIRFTAPDGTLCVGSGLLINDQAILTADHVADGSEHRVDIRGRSHDVSHVLRSGSSTIDLAILHLKDAITGVSPLTCARVDQDGVGQIPRCAAVGFPRWKRDGQKRRSAQVDGTIPTGEGLESTSGRGLKLGFLTLVGNRKPARVIQKGPITEAGTTTPWGGMSGAVVIAEGRLVIGVVRSVNLAADGQSLTVTPLTAIDDLPDHRNREEFWAALGVHSRDELLQLPVQGQQRSPVQLRDYEYDIYVSYWPKSFIDPWIRNRFIKPFRSILLEELGRQPSIFIADDTQKDNEAVTRSRVLLAVLSKQYFYHDRCRVAFESMLRREAEEGFSTAGNPMRLVHTIIAHDFLSDEVVPSEYRGKFYPINFKDWAYDFEIQEWQIYKSFNDAVSSLASDIAAAVIQAPGWRSEFPIETPVMVNPPIQRRPTF